MKQKLLILSIFLVCSISITAYAGLDLNVPIVPGGKEVAAQTPNTYNLEYTGISLNQIIAFYAKEFKDQSEIKWKEPVPGKKTVIYDWGSRKWHKITIFSKGNSVLIEIKKDSWTWILGTLIIRFIGVFIVLIVLMIVLQISGAVFSSVKNKSKTVRV